MRRLVFPLGLLITVFIAIFLNKISAPIALLIGLVIGLMGFIKNNAIPYHSKLQNKLLKTSVVGLGFGINLETALEVGGNSFFISLAAIIFTFAIAFSLRFFFKSEKIITFLVASGTAICGGSAIAAVSPGIKANSYQTSIALAVVFVLNSVALLIFPPVGYFFELSQNQFGIWSAIAIHDTSSVVGASNSYGQEALLIATTTKLVRALWIVPLALIVTLRSGGFNKTSFPWFILGFLAAICVNSFVPSLHDISAILVWISKRMLVFTLFLIGLKINVEQLKKLGINTFMVGLTTWLILSVLSFVYVFYYID